MPHFILSQGPTQTIMLLLFETVLICVCKSQMTPNRFSPKSYPNNNHYHYYKYYEIPLTVIKHSQGILCCDFSRHLYISSLNCAFCVRLGGSDWGRGGLKLVLLLTGALTAHVFSCSVSDRWNLRCTPPPPGGGCILLLCVWPEGQVQLVNLKQFGVLFLV